MRWDVELEWTSIWLFSGGGDGGSGSGKEKEFEVGMFGIICLEKDIYTGGGNWVGFCEWTWGYGKWWIIICEGDCGGGKEVDDCATVDDEVEVEADGGSKNW